MQQDGRRQTLCDKGDINNFVWKNVSSNFASFKQIS